MTNEERKKWRELQQKAHSALILCLVNKVMREVSHEETILGVWNKLQELYLQRSLANRLYIKQKLYSYKIQEDKPIVDQLDEFTKAIDDLEALDKRIKDEDKAIMLLNALPRSYDHLKDAMLYGRVLTISLDEIIFALKTKELQKFSEKGNGNHGDNLVPK